MVARANLRDLDRKCVQAVSVLIAGRRENIWVLCFSLGKPCMDEAIGGRAETRAARRLPFPGEDGPRESVGGALGQAWRREDVAFALSSSRAAFVTGSSRAGTRTVPERPTPNASASAGLVSNGRRVLNSAPGGGMRAHHRSIAYSRA